MSTCFVDVQNKKIAIPGYYNNPMTLIGSASLRIINNIIDSPKYDVYIDNNKYFNHVVYKTMTSFITIDAGDRLINIKTKHDHIKSFKTLLLAGGTYTLVLIGTIDNVDVLFLDDTIECDDDTFIYVRFIHAVKDISFINVLLDQEEYDDINYKDSNVLKIPKKRNQVNYDETINLTLQSKKYKLNTYPLYVQQGHIYTVDITGTVDHLFILTKDDGQRRCY